MQLKDYGVNLISGFLRRVPLQLLLVVAHFGKLQSEEPEKLVRFI